MKKIFFLLFFFNLGTQAYCSLRVQLLPDSALSLMNFNVSENSQEEKDFLHKQQEEQEVFQNLARCNRKLSENRYFHGTVLAVSMVLAIGCLIVATYPSNEDSTDPVDSFFINMTNFAHTGSVIEDIAIEYSVYLGGIILGAVSGSISGYHLCIADIKSYNRANRNQALKENPLSQLIYEAYRYVSLTEKKMKEEEEKNTLNYYFEIYKKIVPTHTVSKFANIIKKLHKKRAFTSCTKTGENSFAGKFYISPSSNNSEIKVIENIGKYINITQKNSADLEFLNINEEV